MYCLALFVCVERCLLIVYSVLLVSMSSGGVSVAQGILAQSETCEEVLMSCTGVSI